MRPTHTDPSPELRSVQRLAHLLDSSIRVPGTRWRVGLDPLLGLIPGVGDLAGAGVSAWLLLQAGRLGASRWVLLRMAGNIALEAVVGTVPLLGDLFDAAYKANQRNVRLLESQIADPARVERASRGWVIGVVLGVVVLLAGAAALAIWTAAAVLRALGALLGG